MLDGEAELLLRSFSGADAPNDRIPMLCPVSPTYFAQPNVEACSTDTRAVTAGGSTLSRYSCGWSSNNSHDGMLTTRALIPSALSCSYASRHSATSLPVASSSTSGLPSAASART